MLDQMRQGAQGWVAKVLMGLLVLSFAVWGIGGFQGYRTGTLATVGKEEVSVQEFARLYDQEQRLAAASGQRADASKVMSQLLLGAALDDEARRFGLGVSDDRVAAEIAKTPAFQADGAFNRQRFETLLANARMNPNDYIADVRRDLVRSQIAGSISAGIAVPDAMVEAIYRLRNEERTISYLTVGTSAIDPVGEPTDDELKAYFDDNKSKFAAPEYRGIAYITLDPTSVADPAAVSEDELQAEYDRRKATFETPERRDVEQVSFDSADAAKAAFAEVEGGKSLADAAAAHGATVTDLGLKTKAELFDPGIADAAFTAELDKPVAVTEGALKPSIVQVTQIDPASVTPLSEVEARLRKEIATRSARDKVSSLYDKVEDERAGGSTLKEAADKLSLPYAAVAAVARDLTAPDGAKVTDIPNGSKVVADAFDSDVGIENNAIRAGDSWVFYEVTNIDPAHDRALEEVHDKVVADWRTDETQKRIAAKADKLFADLKGGRPLADVAAEIGATVQVAEGLKRTAAPPAGLSANAVNQAFAGPKGHIANAEGPDGSRIILTVDNVVSPAFFAESDEAKQIKQQLTAALTNDIQSTYNAQLRASLPIDVNNAALQQVAGQLSGSTQTPLQ